MTSVTQTIPTLTGGLSQQPDELKIPGQVNVAKNVIPDVTHGLLKRPGGKLVKSLSDNSTASLNSVENGKWFSYYRDETESYIGQISRDGDINVWDCATGNPMTVQYDSNSSIQPAIINYLTHNNDEDIQTLTLNDFTFITNRQKVTAMSSTVETVRPPEVFIDLKATAYARQYAVNLYDQETTQEVRTATRISVDLVKSSNNYCDTNGGHPSTRDARLNAGNSTRCDDTAGDGRDAYAPNVATRIFEATDGQTLYDGVTTNSVSDSVAQIHGAHSYNVQVKNSNNVNVARGKNLYFRIRTTGQSVPFTTGSGNNQETTYQARYTVTHDLLYGGEGWREGDNFHVWMNGAYYKVTIQAISTTKVQANLALVRPNPTPFDTETAITASSILGDIRNGIIGSTVGGVNDLYQFQDDSDDEGTANYNGFQVKQIGTGIYITRPSTEAAQLGQNGAFNITAPSSDLLRVMSSEVDNVDDLPSQCKHGYVVKIANSAADEDDYYVKFFGNNDKDGDGVWEECAKPGDNIEFDKSTMPIQLVRRFDDSSGTITGTANAPYFSVEQVAWDNALVGTTVDGGTNPRPSFIGNAINKLVFFRNRLVMLSEENVIMSRPGDFFNFWSKTATTFTPQDVIDLSCSSEYPATVYDGIQVNAGLLLFTKNQQFMLTTDSDVLSPETAKLNAVSSYNFNEKTSPVSLGTTVAFLDNANKFTRFFEMSNVLRQGEPDIVDQSAVISRLLDRNINIIAESRENSVVFFSKKGTKTLYGFRYFASGERRLLQAWFTWEVVGDVQYLCMLDDALYVVVKNGSKDQLLKYDITLDSTSNFVTSGTDFPVHLDHSMTTSGWTYNATTNKSTKAKPVGLESTNQLAAYDVDDTINASNAYLAVGRYDKITVNGSNLEIDGDWSSQTFLIGYLYTMQVDLPTIYYTTQSNERWRADTRANTIIHRIKLGFGPVGLYETKLTRRGKTDYTEEHELTPADAYSSNTAAIVDDIILKTIPVYDRNINTALTVKSTHPAPATLYNMTWEGVYNNNHYKSV